jgi:hypothetical protein
VLQAATAAILFTGGNTSFTGFPFLASFVAEDSFLPRWLTRRGHRLAFSNGIILLTALSLSLALMLVAGASVDALIAFYAIGVFTGFPMAGFGMARYHLRTREAGWRRRLVINAAGGTYTALVVVLFAEVKFTEGAWLIVIIFPVLVYMLIRLSRQYRKEAAILEDIGDDLHPHTPNYSRRVVLLLVDGYDPATIAAIKYAKSLHPAALRAVHFSLDSAQADKLRQRWLAVGLTIALELADCPDGCCTTTPRTGSPAGSAASRGRRPPSSRSTSGTKSRRSTLGGSGQRLTGSRTRRPAPTRSGPCTSGAGPPSRVGCTRRRFARAGTTATCWRARSPTRPAS